jgi:hypothetical protein
MISMIRGIFLTKGCMIESILPARQIRVIHHVPGLWEIFMKFLSSLAGLPVKEHESKECSNHFTRLILQEKK